MLQECLLDRVELSSLLQSLDRQHGLSCYILHRRRAGPDRLVVDYDCASTAETLATAILCSSQTEVITQKPQQHAFIIDRRMSRLAVERERNRSLHTVWNTPISALPQ